MKYVLDDRDRSRPWYKGMNNMTPGEMDDYWKAMVKSALLLLLMIGGMIVCTIVIIALSTNSDLTYDDKEKMAACLICFMAGLSVAEVSGVLEIRKRIRMVKEEKGVI